MLKRLTQYLDSHSTRYVVVIHSPAYTAQEIAARAHVPGRELAKTVMAKVDGKMTMLVLPASSMVNFTALRQDAGASRAELATEAEFKGLFPECEVGAMPPFGNLFDMPVLVDRTLLEDEEIAFNAGTHKELVRLSYADFARLVQPTVMSFGIRKKIHEEEIR
ncbi:MAG: YbaK/prolyl-tRNA synthetase associated region [Bacteroidetes bacterium]|nr:YbaK/prolyl-tRNA synthetase associated region [Bacteroidota bacterium]MBP1678333.1 YbaK/prolyl-tRNA synthetase associated region [Bacteroidota bacterium]